MMPFLISTIATSGDASFSSDAKYVAVSNLLDGFEIYQMDSEEPYRAFTHEMGDLFPTPVRFVHGGNAILTGSTVGKPQLWDVDSGRTIHTLPLGRKCHATVHPVTAPDMLQRQGKGPCYRRSCHPAF